MSMSMNMYAAVVRSFDHPPRYEMYDTPEPTGPHEVLVDVRAAGRAPAGPQADAAGLPLATSTGTLPMIPGVDGVGRLRDGSLLYFVVSPDGVWGSMADRALVDLRPTLPLPAQVDVVEVAAVMNPAMSSWVALRRRVPLGRGQSVLVLGATGNAGAMAVQVAKHLGAGRVVGAGRNRERLADLPAIGADEVVVLSDDGEATAERLASSAADVDIVVDYLWAEPAATAMMAILEARADRSRALDWIQIGAMAGPTLELPSVALRSANLRIQGNGQGAVSTRDYLAELPSLVDEIDRGTFVINASAVPLADVEEAWSASNVPELRIASSFP